VRRTIAGKFAATLKLPRRETRSSDQRCGAHGDALSFRPFSPAFAQLVSQLQRRSSVRLAGKTIHPATGVI
jgi:hypothetical protein